MTVMEFGKQNQDTVLLLHGGGLSWYFTHRGDTIHVHCSRKGSRLDAGIALAHLYVSNEESFRFFRVENVPEVTGYAYIGSCAI